MSGSRRRLDGLGEREEVPVGVTYDAPFRIDDEGTRSLAASRVMLHQSIKPTNLPAYKKGLSEAAAIVEMLAFHKRRN